MTITTRLSDWYINLSRWQKRVVKFCLLSFAGLCLFYIYGLPLKRVPMALPLARSTPAATAATRAFWTIFQANEHEKLPGVLQDLTAAYGSAPGDAELATVLAGAHLWHFQVRSLFGKAATDATADLRLAIQYAQAAQAITQETLQEKSALPSVLTTAHWQLRLIEQPGPQPPPIEREPFQAIHLDLLVNAQSYPEFAGWVQAWLLAAMLPPDSPRYGESELGYYAMLDTCSIFGIPRDLRFNKFIHSLYGLVSFANPVCYQNPVAPHNIEGALLAIADMYLKKGDLPRARLWYANVKSAPNYEKWRFQAVVEERLAMLETLAEKFVADTGQIDVVEPAMSFQTVISCAVCHADDAR